MLPNTYFITSAALYVLSSVALYLVYLLKFVFSLFILQLFQVFDTNNDGFISETELSNAMKNLGESLTNEDLKSMIKAADLDGDGKINYNGNLHIKCFTCSWSHNCFFRISIFMAKFVQIKRDSFIAGIHFVWVISLFIFVIFSIPDIFHLKPRKKTSFL